MGTETRSISSNTFHSGLFSVKLNNPLMGTEIRGTYDNQCPKRSLVTKLNDPHKGTETLSRQCFLNQYRFGEG